MLYAIALTVILALATGLLTFAGATGAPGVILDVAFLLSVAAFLFFTLRYVGSRLKQASESLFGDREDGGGGNGPSD